MSAIKSNRTADQIETQLIQTLKQMTEYQQNGNYVEAENSRLTSEKLKKELEARRVFEMEQRHQQQNSGLTKTHEEELAKLNITWEKTISDHNAQGDRLIKQLETKHESDQQKTKQELEAELPLKVKESSECLNLRKQEQYMVKQKNYVEAHIAQQKIIQLEKAEKEKWLIGRGIKIETALNTLKGKQEIQIANLKKKIKSGLDEHNKQHKKQEQKLNLKYANIEKQQKMQHEKEKLAFRGQFKSKGGQGSPLLTKTKLFSSRD